MDPAVANAAADKAADWGRELHEQVNQELAKEVKVLYWHATVACRVIAALLPLWPKLERSKLRTGERRGRVGIATECPEKQDKHSWIKGRAHWTCEKCMCQTKTLKLTKRRMNQRCGGREDCLAEKAGKLGHRLEETACGKEQLIFCRTCGAWTENVPVKLKERCTRFCSAAGKVSLRRIIEEEVHPKYPTHTTATPPKPDARRTTVGIPPRRTVHNSC